MERLLFDVNNAFFVIITVYDINIQHCCVTGNWTQHKFRNRSFKNKHGPLFTTERAVSARVQRHMAGVQRQNIWASWKKHGDIGACMRAMSSNVWSKASLSKFARTQFTIHAQACICKGNRRPSFFKIVFAAICSNITPAGCKTCHILRLIADWLFFARKTDRQLVCMRHWMQMHSLALTADTNAITNKDGSHSERNRPTTRTCPK